MFGRIGRFAARHAKAILIVITLVLAGAGAFGFTAFGKLKSQGFNDPAAESSQAAELVRSHFDGGASLVFLIKGPVDDPAVEQAGTTLTQQLSGDPELRDIASYFSTGAPPMRSNDGAYAIAVAKLNDNADVDELRARYDGVRGPIDVTLGGGATVGTDIGAQVGQDLLVAEAIAVPLILILLVIAFGSVVAALIPLAVGGIAILGTFAELAVLGSVTDVSIFAINLTTALGLGLAIDYALLMVSRFREELARGSDTTAAVVRTVETAGRTIFFSGLAVTAALAVLLVFPMYFLRSFAYAGVGVVVIAMSAALIVLPALLAVLGPRINAGKLSRRTPSTASPFWARFAGSTMRRPARAAVPVVIALAIAAIPLLHVQFGTPDDRVLPQSSDTRIVGDALRDHFPDDNSSAVQAIATTPINVADYTERLSALPGAGRVTAARSNGAVLFSIVPQDGPRSAQAETLVGAIRSSGMDLKVGGDTAQLMDTKQAIGSRLPLAASLIALTTFVLLFLFTGSVLQPLRALLFNVLGLSATLGLMVLVFQDGWLSGFLGFTPLPLDTSMLVLLFCITFGLSMDYEVFVLSRIKEMHDQGTGLHDAVVQGLSRTGRLVSTAAVLLAVSLLAFATSGVSFIQLFGIGSGLAILIDATLIRGVLVPAGMRLLGRTAWWSPKPLRRLHNRVGIQESVPEREPASV
ncbi:RND superfamily putative drug exporter [Kibdelosporangium banguiense]|uniref:RND superfamily putative drug exporter n=1 Tax=Kibdelosporangium banguiense TaxID=1365924 RepID=A0ABS4TJK0_9PSEU|nr:MMPL family transporter [Kibdelosporangium banguiense]MBP2324200.1 RND superfamily putative drug exporter [Kibdelosporangium banguiense]